MPTGSSVGPPAAPDAAVTPTMSEQETGAPPVVAVIVALPGTEPAVTLNETEVVPAGTVTEAGTEALVGADAVRVTNVPPTGAGALKFTVATPAGPKATSPLGQLIPVSVGGGGGGITMAAHPPTVLLCSHRDMGNT